MAYQLNFFSLPGQQLLALPQEPGAVREYLRKNGKPVGLLAFQPGEATLFLSAAESLTGLEFLSLLKSPLGEAEPTEDQLFGGLEREQAQEALGAIEGILAEMGDKTAGLAELAEAHDLTPQHFLDLLKDLRQLLADALEGGGDVVTLYG